jgi:hypothetical protein
MKQWFAVVRARWHLWRIRKAARKLARAFGYRRNAP